MFSESRHKKKLCKDVDIEKKNSFFLEKIKRNSSMVRRKEKEKEMLKKGDCLFKIYSRKSLLIQRYRHVPSTKL